MDGMNSPTEGLWSQYGFDRADNLDSGVPGNLERGEYGSFAGSRVYKGAGLCH